MAGGLEEAGERENGKLKVGKRTETYHRDGRVCFPCGMEGEDRTTGNKIEICKHSLFSQREKETFSCF